MLEKVKALKKSAFEGRLNKKSSKDRYLVALDIGTEFVKALIGRVVDNDKIEIVGMGRVHQGLADMQAGAISDIAAVVGNCNDALDEAEKQAGVSARAAVIGIAGELVKGTTTSVKFTRKDPTRALDLPEVERIIELVQQRAQEKAKKQLAWELGGKDVEIRLVNSALVSIEIDDYAVTNPVGFQGKDVVVHLYTAFAPLIHIGALERTAKELDIDLVAVAAEPFAVARSVIGNDPNATTSAILMDVGGGTTDIALINEGGMQGTKMFGIGGRAYTRSIERDLGVDFEKAEALKLALGSSKITGAQADKLEESLQKTLRVWTSGVQLALSEFEQLEHLPYKLLLCGGGSSLDILVDTLSDGSWYKGLPFTRKPQVHHIHPDEVNGIVDKTGQVNDHTYITAMGLLRVGMDTVNQHDDNGSAGSIKERFNRILSV